MKNTEQKKNTLPEVVVTGYAPIKLTTYYPFISKYPYTGHSKLEIPIDRDVWYKYVGEVPKGNLLPYITIDKTMRAKNYNLLTNNCANATLNYLNKAFKTKEVPTFFTTPGDVEDYALKYLNGKLIKNNDGSNTVLIPRTKQNADKISETALDMMFDEDTDGIANMSYKLPQHKKGEKIKLQVGGFIPTYELYKAYSDLGKQVSNFMSTPVQVLPNLGNASTYNTVGLYLPRTKSTVGKLLSYLTDLVLSPSIPSDIVSLKNLGKNAIWFAKHPRAIKVYHVNKNGLRFPLQQARTASASSVGVHVTPNKEIAESFNPNAPVMEAWMPRHDMETIDIYNNNYNILTNNYVMLAAPKSGKGPVLSYNAAGNDKLRFLWIKEAGGKPSLENTDVFNFKTGNIEEKPYKMYIENLVEIPLRDKIWPNRTSEIDKEIDLIFALPSKTPQAALEKNLKIADLLSRNNKKVIKYNNVLINEGGGGTSYIVTDPSVFFTPEKFNFPINTINYIKYAKINK